MKLFSLIASSAFMTMASATVHITTFTGQGCDGAVVDHRPVNDLDAGLWHIQSLVPGPNTHSYEIKADEYINLYTWSAKQAPECGAPVTASGSIPIGSEEAVTQRLCFFGSPTCKLGAIQWWRLE